MTRQAPEQSLRTVQPPGAGAAAPDFPLPPAGRFLLAPQVVRCCWAFAGVGTAAFLVGIIVAPRPTWAHVLLVSFYLLSLSLGAAVLLALLHVTVAGWATALRRVPEALAAALPVGAVGVALVLLAYPALYPWTDPHHAHGPAVPFKEAWLSWPFYLARAAVYVACWYGLIRALLRCSRRQDVDGDICHTHASRRLSALFLVVFAVTVWLSSYDWIMSLEPEWYSTMFGVYVFAGQFLGALAAVTLLASWLHRAGPFRHVLTEAHLHDLGKLLFGFSTFWMYIWFSQYVLIWYVNIPEETIWLIRREQGFWQPLLIASLVLNWVVPFFVLLPQATKRNPVILVQVCIVILLGRWLDLCLMILPAVGEPSPLAVAAGVGLLLGGLGIFCLAVFRALGQASLLPVRDPLLVESLHQSVATLE